MTSLRYLVPVLFMWLIANYAGEPDAVYRLMFLVLIFAVFLAAHYVIDYLTNTEE